LVSSVTLALAATIFAPGFRDQAGDAGLCICQPARLLTPILAEFCQVAVCQISPQGFRSEFIGGFPVRTGRFTHRAQQIVRDMQAVLGCHDALLFSVPQDMLG
jgi:hypothetical protein